MVINDDMHPPPAPPPPSDPKNKNSNSRSAATHNGATGNNHHKRNQHSPELQQVKINDIVGNGICGLLYKWVNYGKGWRPRWFVLQDGVLSYYKVHGPDKIVINQETEKGSRVIGEEWIKRILRHHRHHHHKHGGNGGSSSKSRKPFGEVHLKVLLFQFSCIKNFREIYSMSCLFCE